MLRIVLLAILLEVATAHRQYMLVCPRMIRPAMQYTCHLTRVSKFPRLNMTVAIESYNQPPVVSKTFDIYDKDISFTLQIPNNLTYTTVYRLKVDARDRFGAPIIESTYTLSYYRKNNTVFIQTDKAIYKPGQTVQFRVFAVNSELDVLHRTFDIYISDPSNNRIAQWRNVKSDSGVFQGQMVMSLYPPLGYWSIEVIYDDATSMKKRFSVEEFVLPKFEVSLSTLGFGVMTETSLTGTVNAKYTFGKGLQGNGTLVVYRRYYSKRFTLKFDIDGTYKFRIDREELFSVLGITYATSLELEVNVTETVTGKTLSDDATIQYYNRADKISIDGTPYFKPGLRYKTYIVLTDQKDRPLRIQKPEVRVSVTFFSKDNDTNERQINKTVRVKDSGIGKVSVKVPKSVTGLLVNAMYGDLVGTRKVYQFQSPSSSYIHITALTKDIVAGKEARFLITSTRPKKSVYFMIKSKAGVSQPTKVYIQSRKLNISVPITRDMAPFAQLLVYYIKKTSSEVVADAVQFNIRGIFDNKVNIRFKKKTIKPGRKVSLVVKADPGSQCNVLAVDKSVLLLRKGNDITADMVEDDMAMYGDVRRPYCYGLCVQKLFPTSIPARDVSTIFNDVRLVVISNAEFHRASGTAQYSDYYDYYYSAGFSTAGTTSTAQEYFSSVASSRSESSEPTSAGTEQAPQPEKEIASPKIRSLFPDTWIYSNNTVANSRGKCYLKATVPDTITSWVATAFAVHNSSGLGVAPESASLDVFLKFFVRLELPYSVTRGEQLILKASVFNFHSDDIEVNVILKNTGCYNNIILSQSTNGSSILSFSKDDVFRKVKVGADNAVTLKFPIQATGLGECEIDIRALSASVSDAVQRQLLVKAEGIEESYNIPILIDVDDNSTFHLKQPITIPEDVVPGSATIRLAVVGDIMGPTLNGIDNLLRMPYGCGEQNMISMVPNIFAIQYLEAVDNLTPDIMEKGKAYMVSGYQRELGYLHADASYSAYGSSDRSGSTWLTAFVVKSFAQASPYIYIDPSVMSRSIRWILGQFNEKTGYFEEPGRVWSSWLKGESGTSARTLASFTLVALLEAKKAGFVTQSVQKLFDRVSKGAIQALEGSVSDMTNIYELAISSYALSLSDSKKADTVLEKLETDAMNTGLLKHWEIKGHYGRSRNIEATSYVLLTYVVKEDIGNAVSVMRWLVKQRNAFGGFSSTQDTVVGLQALADIAALIYTSDFNLQIKTTPLPAESIHVFYVNQENSLLYQTLFIPQTTSMLEIDANGKGTTLLQISVTYNVMEDPVEPMFDLVVSSTEETMDGFKLKACFKWLGDGVSGMAVMEIGLLSGFSADRFSVTSLSILKKTEDGDNMIVLYFDEIPSDMECIELLMTRTDLVAGSQPAVVKLLDYYDPDNHVFSLYQPELLKDTNVCDIGGGEDIWCTG